MFAIGDINAWHWVAFLVGVLVFLGLDLGVFHTRAEVIKFKEALIWTGILALLAMCFAGLLVPLQGTDDALEFLTGYLTELALSMDNVSVIALTFAYFRVPAEHQHRILFWGILGALLMRGLMIVAGAALVAKFHWILYGFGLFLIYTGIKMALSREEGVHPEKNIVLRLAGKIFPVVHEFHGSKFTIVQAGRRALTPLALVLLTVETTDLIFALDSIPAIFGVTQKPFIIFTSNVFAILGLRSLYFVLAGALRYFRYLKIGLSLVLVFVGIKMLLEIWEIKLRIRVSLLAVLGIILGSMIFSVLAGRQQNEVTGESRP
ncbi:MAG TPA: TerC family protein [Candidatus Saccharimonadales bacterium]|nr:TerC family protein [Candidatus Saccharimonadales bacterium]